MSLVVDVEVAFLSLSTTVWGGHPREISLAGALSEAHEPYRLQPYALN